MAADQNLCPRLSAVYEDMMKKYESKLHADALQIADKILEDFPNHGETLSMKGLLFIKVNPTKKEEALELLKLGIRNHFHSSLTWHALAIFNRDEGNLAESLKAYRAAVMKSHNKIGMYKDMTHISLVMRDYALAYQFSTNISIHKGSAEVYNIRSICKYLIGEFTTALNIIKEGQMKKLFDSVDKHHRDEISHYEAMLCLKIGQSEKVPSILQHSTIDPHMENTLLLLAAIWENNVVKSKDCVRNLIRAYPANLDYIYMYMYVNESEDVRNVFGDPLSKYRKSGNRLMGKHCINKPSFEELVQRRVDDALNWEPFRGDIENSTPLRDATWQSELVNTSIYIYYKTEVGSKAKNLINYINLLKHMDGKASDGSDVKNFAATSARILKLMDEVQTITGGISLDGWRLYFYVHEDRGNKLTEFIQKNLRKGVLSLVRDLTPFIIYSKTRDMILNLSRDLERDFDTDNKSLSNQATRIHYYLYMAELLTVYLDFEQARSWYKKAIDMNPYASNGYMVAALVEMRAGDLVAAVRFTGMLTKFDVTEKCKNSLAARVLLLNGSIEESFQLTSEYTAEGSPRDIMNCQASWFFKNASETAIRFGRLGEAMVFLDKLLDDAAECLSDCYDFHQYSARKGVLMHYASFVSTLSRFYESEDLILAMTRKLMLQLHILRNSNKLVDYYQSIKDKEVYTRPTPMTRNPNAPPSKDQDITGIHIIKKLIESDTKANEEVIQSQCVKLAEEFVERCPIINQSWFMFYCVGAFTNNENMKSKSIKRLQTLDIHDNCLYLLLIRATQKDPDALEEAERILKGACSSDTMNTYRIVCAILCLQYFKPIDKIETYIKCLPILSFADSLRIKILLDYYPLEKSEVFASLTNLMYNVLDENAKIKSPIGAKDDTSEPINKIMTEESVGMMESVTSS